MRREKYMSNKNKLKKLPRSLIIKGLICLICLASVSFALLTYANALTLSPTTQFNAGTSTASWIIYVNEVNQARYMPGGFSEPTLNTGDTSTYAFKVVTNANNVCAVKVELTSAMDETEFPNFEVTILSSTGQGGWSTEPLYASSTGGTTKAFINGLIQGDAAYIHQGVSTTKYYLIQVTYTYVPSADNSQTHIPASFMFTPFTQASFA